MQSVTVGVVIPTFERVNQTITAVDSVLAQTAQANRIIVIDDGSSSGSQNQLRQSLKIRNVEYYSIEHTGHPGRARNAGVAKLDTTHVAFLDSDDTWSSRKLEVQKEVASRGVKAQCAAIEADSDGSRNLKSISLSDLIVTNRIMCSSVLIERALLDEVGGMPTSFVVRGIEDYAAWLRISYLTDWVRINENLVSYTDVPEKSIRGTMECGINPRTLALLDFNEWLKKTGLPVPMSVRGSERSYQVSFYLWARWGRRNRFVGKRQSMPQGKGFPGDLFTF